jgi:hypothetical protein
MENNSETNTWPVPNEHGSYPSDDLRGETIKVPFSKGTAPHIQAQVDVLQVGPNKWAFGINAFSPDGGHGGPISDKNGSYPTRNAAVSAGFDQVIQHFASDKSKGGARLHKEILKFVNTLDLTDPDSVEEPPAPVEEPAPPKIIRRTTRLLRVAYSDREVLDKASELSSQLQTRNRFRSELKNTVSMIQAKIKAVDTQITTLTEQVSTRADMRDIPCEWHMHTPEKGMKTLYRADTMETVDVSAMVKSDHQMVLDDLNEQNGVTERTLDEKPIGEITEDDEEDDDDGQSE